ncbi:MAG: hypothetical protein QM541_07390 [Flavobacterium sp.]|nr:hypothetical protein [Flavobacterium sp.]
MILQFATKLKHPAEFLLRFANIQYTSDNVANTAVKNVTSIKKMFPDLKEIALFDNIPNLQPN